MVSGEVVDIKGEEWVIMVECIESGHCIIPVFTLGDEYYAK